MRQATFLMAVAVLAGLFTTQAFAENPHVRTSIDGRIDVLTVGHPGSHHRRGGFDAPRHHGYAHPRGYPYGVSPLVPRHGPPVVVYPYWGYPPVYPRHRHVCGPGCGCGHSSSFYYRGNGWGFSFSF